MTYEGNTAQPQPMFGVYDILETIGQGGMGIVYRAHDTSLDRIVALKVLKEDLRANKQISARFQREAETFASLNHPNIVHIYSVGTVGRIPYFAMELIDGSPLSQAMKRIKRIEWKRALRIAEQIADALATAHDAHIIHRDIKPGNILLDKNDRAYVTDFGIAKVLTAETQLTVEGSRLGTPQYMSPERCMNREITPSSDLYSLGVVLFQMISGRLPYESSSPIELIKKIVSDPPSRLSDFVADVPEDVERLVAYLIEKKPEDRPGDADTVAMLCRRVLEGEPLAEIDGVASSLQNLRDSLSTPTPGSTSHSGIDSTWHTPLWSGMKRRWRDLTLSGRIWTIGAGAILLSAVAGGLVARQANEGYALDTVRRWDRGTARWTQPAVTAEFVPESPGVNIVRLNLPMFSPHRTVPAASSGFVVELRGWPRSVREGESSLVSIMPETQRTQLALPPAGSGSAGPPQLVAAADGGAGATITDRFYFVQWAGNWRGETRPVLYAGDATLRDGAYGHLLASFDDLKDALQRPVKEIGPVAVSESAGEMVAAVSDGVQNGWALVRAALGDRGSVTNTSRITEAGPAFGTVVYSGGDSVLYTRLAEDAGGAGIWRTRLAGERDPELLWRTEAPNTKVVDLRSDAALVAAAMDTPQTRRVIKYVPFASGAAADLGPGEYAVFDPLGGRALVSAADRRGNLQLWTVSLAEPGARRQLTFLATGIRPEISVSADGRYALAVVADEGLPRLLAVNVSEAEKAAPEAG